MNRLFNKLENQAIYWRKGVFIGEKLEFFFNKREKKRPENSFGALMIGQKKL